MTKKRDFAQRVIPRFRTDSRHYRILEEISAGDLFVGFLFSATSTRLMYTIASTRAKERYANRLAIERLESCGYVRRMVRNGESTFFATKAGKAALRKIYDHSSQSINHPEAWDGRWRVIAYDFPNTESSLRNSLRHVLGKSHFLQIQKSVWISPYDCTLLSELLAENSLVAQRAIVMLVEHHSKEGEYKKHFKIS